MRHNLISKEEKTGWLVLILLVAALVWLQMVKLILFLLFMYLVSDFLMSTLGNRIRFLSARVVFYLTYLALITGVVLIFAVILPSFIHQLPGYGEKLEAAIRGHLPEWETMIGHSIDYDSLRDSLQAWARTHLGETFHWMKRAAINTVLLIIALIMNFVIVHGSIEVKEEEKPRNLFEFLVNFLADKFKLFYGFFRQTMGAQVIIALINTAITLVLLFALGIPYKFVLTVIVFFGSLLPVVGNLISNAFVCSAALFWAGTWQFIAALIALVVIHKLEYVLNGKIIGDRVKLPFYATIPALLIGEGLLRISGLILAIPFLLFVRHELSVIALPEKKQP